MQLQELSDISIEEVEKNKISKNDANEGENEEEFEQAY